MKAFLSRPLSLRLAILLIALDLFGLGASVVIYAKQQSTLDTLHTGICRNADILADGLRKDIAQSQNTELYQQFFPQIGPAQLKVVIARQTARDRSQIQQLEQGCT